MYFRNYCRTLTEMSSRCDASILSLSCWEYRKAGFTFCTEELFSTTFSSSYPSPVKYSKWDTSEHVLQLDTSSTSLPSTFSAVSSVIALFPLFSFISHYDELENLENMFWYRGYWSSTSCILYLYKLHESDSYCLSGAFRIPCLETFFNKLLF